MTSEYAQILLGEDNRTTKAGVMHTAIPMNVNDVYMVTDSDEASRYVLLHGRVCKAVSRESNDDTARRASATARQHGGDAVV